MSDFKGRHEQRKFVFSLDAPTDRVFPLLCPVREKDWVPRWDYQMIYSQSGFAEEGCVFKSGFPPFGNSLYVFTRHDPVKKEADIIRLACDQLLIKMAFRLSPGPGNTTSLELTYTYTGLNEEGNRLLERYIMDTSGVDSSPLEKPLRHYLSTGRMLEV